jgi:hypothetical protein
METAQTMHFVHWLFLVHLQSHNFHLVVGAQLDVPAMAERTDSTLYAS